MTLFNKVRDILKKNNVCPKCNCETYGEKFCLKCSEYVRIVEKQKALEVEAKEDLKRRNWIKLRDEFLKNQNGKYN